MSGFFTLGSNGDLHDDLAFAALLCWIVASRTAVATKVMPVATNASARFESMLAESMGFVWHWKEELCCRTRMCGLVASGGMIPHGGDCVELVTQALGPTPSALHKQVAKVDETLHLSPSCKIDREHHQAALART